MGTIITSCTKKKIGDVQVSVSTLAPGKISSVGNRWVAALKAIEASTPASKLYQGGSHAESRRAAIGSGFSHFIVSAGLGLISAEVAVPNYAASVLTGDDDVLARLQDADAAEWWHWLQGHSPFARSLESQLTANDGPCLVALPKAYLAMIASYLLALPGPLLARVRIFSGSRAPAALAHLQMPYDDRLDGIDSPYKGTRSNFAPRAMRHFALNLLPSCDGHSAAQHHAAVAAALADWRRPTRTLGQRKTDAELRDILRANWEAMEGRSTRMLRLLRDNLGIACEQSRFAGLVRDLRAEQGIGA